MMVVARQLGVPVSVQGTISATIIGTSVFAKPFISGIADYFPSYRKTIFLSLLTVLVVAIGPIGFLPPLYDPPTVQGKLLQSLTGDLYLQAHGSGRCSVKVAWDCLVSCNIPETCPLGNLTVTDIGLSVVHSGDVPFPNFHEGEFLTLDVDREVNDLDVSQLMRTPDHHGMTVAPEIDGPRNTSWILFEDGWYESPLYLIKGFPLLFGDDGFNVSIKCAGGERSGKGCTPPWVMPEFWLYVTLLLVGKIASSTCYSISNAICCDTIGKDGDYGSQRAWGALSYGLMGILSGLLVDWCSETNTVKDYTPAFLLMVVCGFLDILLSAVYLRVPKLENGSKVWANIRPLLCQPHFLIFLGFAFLIGFYDGLDTGYVFVLQEDMAVGSQVMRHMKLLQGTTMLVQAFSAVPFMFISDWFMKRLGAQKVITIVLFLYAIRLLGLALASALKAVWITIAFELINGPCFGLGFTAIIVHASNITPKGTSNTIQSVVGVCYGTLGYAGASLMGGLSYEAVGGQNLYSITGAAAFVTCLLHLAYQKFFPSPQDTKERDLEAEATEKDLKIQPELLKMIDTTCNTNELDKKSVEHGADAEKGEKKVLPMENDSD